MKNSSVVFLVIAIMGCHQPKTETVKSMETIGVKKDSASNNFANLNFASKKDLSCGMPITAGVEDTASYKGKLYGFCSPECKADFLKDPEGKLAAK